MNYTINADEHEIFADNIRKFGIIKDDSVEDPDWCLFAVELIENGFQDTNKQKDLSLTGTATSNGVDYLLKQVKVKAKGKPSKSTVDNREYLITGKIYGKASIVSALILLAVVTSIFSLPI